MQQRAGGRAHQPPADERPGLVESLYERRVLALGPDGGPRPRRSGQHLRPSTGKAQPSGLGGAREDGPGRRRAGGREAADTRGAIAGEAAGRRSAGAPGRARASSRAQRLRRRRRTGAGGPAAAAAARAQAAPRLPSPGGSATIGRASGRSGGRRRRPRAPEQRTCSPHFPRSPAASSRLHPRGHHLCTRVRGSEAILLHFCPHAKSQSKRRERRAFAAQEVELPGADVICSDHTATSSEPEPTCGLLRSYVSFCLDFQADGTRKLSQPSAPHDCLSGCGRYGL